VAPRKPSTSSSASSCGPVTRPTGSSAKEVLKILVLHGRDEQVDTLIGALAGTAGLLEDKKVEVVSRPLVLEAQPGQDQSWTPFVTEAAAWTAGNTLLQCRPSLVLMLPPVQSFARRPARLSEQKASLRSPEWPWGHPGLPAELRKEIVQEDAALFMSAGLLDALIEAGPASPPFALLIPEAFGSVGEVPVVEPFLHSRLQAVAGLAEVQSGAFRQCCWAKGPGPAAPVRFVSNCATLCERASLGPPRYLPVGRPLYLGPLPRACSCPPGPAGPSGTGLLHPPSIVQLAVALRKALTSRPKGQAALCDGGAAAMALLAGPPRRGPPVPSSRHSSAPHMRPLDLYIGRNARFGDAGWGNPFKIGRDGDASQCCAQFEQHVLSSELLLARLEGLRGRRLRCHCPPSAPCHADILVGLYRRRFGNPSPSQPAPGSSTPPPAGSPARLPLSAPRALKTAEGVEQMPKALSAGALAAGLPARGSAPEASEIAAAATRAMTATGTGPRTAGDSEETYDEDTGPPSAPAAAGWACRCR